MSKSLYIAEKPSVAQEFAKALHLDFSRKDGYLEASEAVVTWCVGHLVTMSYPEAYDEKYKRWSLATLPFLPKEWKYEVISEDLANRISGALDQFTGFSAFTDLMKTRNQTRTAISRALLHILLDIKASQPACMFRVLGFRKDSRAVLTALSEQGALPVVTSLTRSPLDGTSLYPDQLYESVRSLLQQTPYQNEFRRKMLVV